MSKKYLTGKVLTFESPIYYTSINGVSLDYTDDWTLIHRLFDYATDGYTIFRNKKVVARREESELLTEKILKLKGYKFADKPEVLLDSLEHILNWITEKHKLFQIDTKKGKACRIVRYRGKDSSGHNFDNLSPMGKWDGKFSLKKSDIQSISFDNDYINSLKLITRF